MKRLIITAVCLFFAAASPAQAHAFLDRAEPKVGSHLGHAPSVVKIWFTEELESAFSKIEVFDTKGNQVDRKDSKIDPTNQALMEVTVQRLKAGTYKVVWSAVSVDTHHTTGTFSFTVADPAP